MIPKPSSSSYLLMQAFLQATKQPPFYMYF
jgi:hypothetical protein